MLSCRLDNELEHVFAHLLAQYRCKLRNTEGSLRAEERLASELKGQLREANAAGEATRKVRADTISRHSLSSGALNSDIQELK